MRQRMDSGRLAVSGDHDRTSAMRAQILGDGANPALGFELPGSAASAVDAQLHAAEPARKVFDVGGAQREPVIGGGSRDRRAGFHHIKPVHLATALDKISAF